MDQNCQLIISDLLRNRYWSSAVQLPLSPDQHQLGLPPGNSPIELGDSAKPGTSSEEKNVVLGREFPGSPLVVFMPVSGRVKLSDISLDMQRIRQLALELSTRESVIQRVNDGNASENSNPSVLTSHEIGSENRTLFAATPDIFSPSPRVGRFREESGFDRDKCLALHREVMDEQVRYAAQCQAEENKRARVEEIRLGIVGEGDGCEETIVDQSSVMKTMDYNENSELVSQSDPVLDSAVDIYTSIMFAFCDSGTLSYFQAACGLAPPSFCPDDSDDERPATLKTDKK